MRIAIVSPILAATPPSATGPHEQMASLLAEALVDRGHEVILYATGDSHTRGTLRYIRDRPFMPYGENRWREEDGMFYDQALAEHTFWAMSDASRSNVDVVHTHRPVALLAQRALQVPHVHTVHHGHLKPAAAVRALHNRYRALFSFPGVQFVAVSRSQRQTYPEELPFSVIHHALDYRQYPAPSAGARNYLLFIGRLHPSKGAHVAIDVAGQLGIRLKLAGPLDGVRCDGDYFQRAIAPRVDGDRVQYVGEVGTADKAELYRGALAMLNPIQWDEPFGLTMLESIANGTPVLAFRRGAAPEIVAEGLSGHLVDDAAEMVAKVRSLAAFDVARMRADVEERFSIERMVTAYESVYRTARGEKHGNGCDRLG